MNRRPRERPPGSPGTSIAVRARRLPGVTLIEALVAVGVVAVLVLLLAGPLAQFRREGRRAVSYSNLRTHAATFSMYANDYAGILPHFTKPGLISSVVQGGGLAAWTSYFDAFRYWHIALADGYYNGNARDESLFPPGFSTSDAFGHRWPIVTPYAYPCAFIADPAYWNPYTRTGPEQWRATRLSEVLFPSAKTLIVQTWPFTEREGPTGGSLRPNPYRPLPVALADGAAINANESLRRRPGYRRGDGYNFANDGAVHYSDSPPLLHTTDGVRGRDVR